MPVVTNCHLARLKDHPARKLNQLPGDFEIMDVRKYYHTWQAQHNSLVLHSKSFLKSTGNVATTPCKENPLLANGDHRRKPQLDTMHKSMHIVGSLAPYDTSTSQLGGTTEEGVGSKSQNARKPVVKQCINKTITATISMDMVPWKRGNSWDSTPGKRTTG